MVCRGEGGRCGDGRAFMVARRWGAALFSKLRAMETGTRATIKALPSTQLPTRPYGQLMTFAQIDASRTPLVGVPTGLLAGSAIELEHNSVAHKKKEPA